MNASISAPLWLLIAIAALVMIGVGAFAWRALRQQPPPTSSLAPRTPPGPVGLRERLTRLQAAGEWDELLRLLDRTLPEWTTSSSLIEVARATSGLERDLAAVPPGALTNVVTERLSAQARAVSGDLWLLAERLDVAARRRSSTLKQELLRDDEKLLRLRAAIQEARAELDALASSHDRRAALDRAEGRFRALAETARELRSLDTGEPMR
jgi:hypothetical protein